MTSDNGGPASSNFIPYPSEAVASLRSAAASPPVATVATEDVRKVMLYMEDHNRRLRSEKAKGYLEAVGSLLPISDTALVDKVAYEIGDAYFQDGEVNMDTAKVIAKRIIHQTRILDMQADTP
jgi:hypothetical protein